jgi:hypothetical protein
MGSQSDSTAEGQHRSDEAQGGAEQIARKIPAPAKQDVDDDHDRETEQAEECGSPDRSGPPEHGGQRACDVPVLALS